MSSLQYTSKNLLQAVAKRADRLRAASPAVPALDGVRDADALTWQAQDALIERAPKVCAFVE
jgi:hypothetical protein